MLISQHSSTIYHNSGPVSLAADLQYDSACVYAEVKPLSAQRFELGRRFFCSVTQSNSWGPTPLRYGVGLTPKDLPLDPMHYCAECNCEQHLLPNRWSTNLSLWGHPFPVELGTTNLPFSCENLGSIVDEMLSYQDQSSHDFYSYPAHRQTNKLTKRSHCHQTLSELINTTCCINC